MSGAPRVLVTGAGGYIGRHVVTALADRGAVVVAADRRGAERPAGHIDPRAELLAVDVLDASVDVYEASGAPDIVVHLAWESGFVHSSPAHMLRLSDHYRLITGLVESGVRHVVGLGSMHEVGYFEGRLPEDAPTDPQSLYGVAKDALRRALTLYTQQQEVVFQWLRCFYIYGDDAYNRSIFTYLRAAAEDGKATFPFTSGTKQYDFIRVEDLAAQIAATSLQDAVTGVINCGSGVPVSLGAQVESYIADSGYDIALEYGAYPDRPYDSPAIWADTGKIESIMAVAEETSSIR
ncbi:NAD-dependent epimerase/dehydratase family protein [Leifsonia sp. NPDC058194]|uniref:NAD-dependent epimerase/dehydratase family protein n=1 Tax=Leifsonia sp. NPDC058194 TaxID=3346374 RepID=UPI0036DA194F